MAHSLEAALASAHQRIMERDLIGADREIDAIERNFGPSAPLLHLRGLAAKAKGDFAAAEGFMRESLLEPGVAPATRAEFANNLANLLANCGFTFEAEDFYREALRLKRDLAPAAFGLARVLALSHRAEEAVQVLQSSPPASRADEVLVFSEACARAGAAHVGLAILERAANVWPNDHDVRIGIGRRLRELGRLDESTALLQHLFADNGSAESALALSETLSASQRWSESLQALEAGLERFPNHVGLHHRRAAIAWVMGDTTGFDEPLRAAVARWPDDYGLRSTLARALLEADRRSDAESVLREALTPASTHAPLLANLALRCAEAPGGLAQADEFMARALEASPGSVEILEGAATLDLMNGRSEAACAKLEPIRARRPNACMTNALWASARRQAGGDDWRQLADPELVCRTYTIPTPAGYSSLEAFNADLASVLRSRHVLKAYPLANSLRGGTQIQIDPNTEKDPVLSRLFLAIADCVDAYIDAMPDDRAHPMWSRRAKDWRFSGAWSVRLRSGGRHVNHVHPEGWISSAYYVVTPPQTGDDRKGWLKFGQPPFAAPGLDPAGWVRPAPGVLALFPSYVWHGVEPFSDGDERMTVAFDVLPIPANLRGVVRSFARSG